MHEITHFYLGNAIWNVGIASHQREVLQAFKGFLEKAIFTYACISGLAPSECRPR